MNTTDTRPILQATRPAHSHSSFTRALTRGTTAGVAAGFIVLVPVLILQLSRGIGVIPEMQLAASSLIGMTAYAGTSGLIVGALLHFFVSIVPAIVYALVASRLPVVNRLAWLGGPLLGIIIFFFMGFVVLPHSAFITPPSVSPMPLLPALLIHMFGLGLPIALIVRRG
jgi:hypothetical protein